ncbi:AfsR/SARP family transcriptional regulator [Yinghuangia sp. YIM S10712]|uniref:AfsR/SARP family transcriptional regulator n=1 Tax=Yinghuangia sp. YIM S10712 TaxID=3436930 RepID=UPI003F52F82E
MHVSVLGPLLVRDDEGEAVTVSGARLRLLLTRLALDAGRPVPTESLVDAVWERDGPAGAANALQSLVSRLRRMLGAEAVTSGPAGYTLALDPGAVDAHQFERVVARGRRLLAEGDPAAAESALTEALGLWRGAALADAPAASFAVGPATRLEELRLTAIEDRADARLRLGRAPDVVPELEELATEHPLRERLHALLMAALDAVGRRADALAVYRAVRGHLADELGIDPSPELDAAYLAVLRGERSVRPDQAAAAPGNPAASDAHMPPPDRRDSSAAGTALTGATDTGNPAGAPATAADEAPASPPPAATNLTARLTSFVGRDSDRGRLADMLRQARLVSVVGPGGAGKTRLTVETGARLLPDFPGGVWFVELASVHDPADIPQAVLAALGRRDVGVITVGMVETQVGGTPGRDALDRVAEILAGRRPTLLILDNCEHLVASAAAVADVLLTEAPALRVLTSTREPLGIDGELLYPLGPLSLPSDSGDVAAALESPAVRLFADRARAVRPSLVIDAANIGAVTEICRRLDGMPLAIELAAARTRSLTPTQIARRLDDRFRLLTAGSRTAMPRHQTLRAVVEWSWDLLEPREQALLRRLSVFAGGATLDAAETVLADPGGELVDRDDVLDLLSGLVDKSLVDMFGTGEPRYRMLETIAAFAAERRDDTGADAGVARRHLEWCFELLERTNPMLRTGEQLDGFAAISEEHDNIAVALRFAIDNRDAPSAVRLVALMGWYWAVRGYHREAAAWLRDALALPVEAPDPDPEPRVLAMWFLGITLVSSGEESEGLRWLMRGRWALRHLPGNPLNPLLDLVRVMSAGLRDFTRGTTEEIDTVAEHGEPWIRAVADLMGGHLAINIGRGEDGVRRLAQARARFLELGDRWGRSSAAGGLSEVYRFTGRFQEALAALDECLELIGRLGAVEDVPLLLSRRGTLRLRMGDEAGARADMNKALEVAEEGETAGGLVLAYAWAGDMARILGDRDEARLHYARAEEELPRTRSVPFQMVACLQVSLAYFADLPAERGKARLALDAALAAALDGRDMPIVATVGEGLAWYAFHDGAPVRAAELLGASVAVRGHRDLASLDAERVTNEVRAALSQEEYDKAFARGAALSQQAAVELMKRS